jgi:hypothetical protein
MGPYVTLEARARTRFESVRAGEKGAPECPGERRDMLPLILILILLAIIFGGFFVFTLKVAVVVAIVLVLLGMFGGYSYRGRRTV